MTCTGLSDSTVIVLICGNHTVSYCTSFDGMSGYGEPSGVVCGVGPNGLCDTVYAEAGG